MRGRVRIEIGEGKAGTRELQAFFAANHGGRVVCYPKPLHGESLDDHLQGAVCGTLIRIQELEGKIALQDPETGSVREHSLLAFREIRATGSFESPGA